MSSTPWPPWLKDDKKTANWKVEGYFANFKAQLDTLPPSVIVLTTFALGSATAISSVLFYKRYGRRIRNSAWVTPKLLTRTRWIKGVVTSVGDGDNFRLYHTPPIGYSWPVKFRGVPTLAKDLKNETLHIRIAGVDAPEAAHFGKPAQPYSADSLEWLRGKILGGKVYCQLLRKDQYNRVVAQVYLPPVILPGFLFYGKNLASEMLKAGWADTYEQAGAEYGKLGKAGYLQLVAEAKAARRGMWEHGATGETPAEYKRRHARAGSLGEAEAVKPAMAHAPPPKSWWKRLFSR